MASSTKGKFKTVDSTVGVAAASALAAYSGRNFMLIVNNSASNLLAYTIDGADPVINGRGITLNPGGSMTYDYACPISEVRVIANGANTPYHIEWL